MQTKRNLLKAYLEEKADMGKLKSDYQDSWLFETGRPFNELKINGIVGKIFNHTLIKEAIEYAGYKHKDSEAVYIIALEEVENIVDEHRAFLTN